MTSLGSGHCCTCSLVCHHVSGPFYCAAHDPRNVVVTVPLSRRAPEGQSDYLLQKVIELTADLGKVTAERDEARRELLTRIDAAAVRDDDLVPSMGELAVMEAAKTLWTPARPPFIAGQAVTYEEAAALNALIEAVARLDLTEGDA